MRRPDRWTRVCALSAAAVAALAAPFSAASQTPFPACFRVTAGEWTPAPAGPDDRTTTPPDTRGFSTAAHLPPSRIELREEPAPHPLPPPPGRSATLEGWFRVEAPGVADLRLTEVRWQVRSDSLFLRFGTLHHGIQGGLARDGAGWGGLLREYSDEFPTLLWERRVTLEPVDCAGSAR